MDRQFSPAGEIVEVPEYLQIHVTLFWRTFWMSAVITSILLFVVVVFYLVFNRLIGVDKVKLG